VQAGEFQRVTAGRGLHRHRTNASRNDWVHFFRSGCTHPRSISILDMNRNASQAQRRSGLCVVASFDARRGSLRIHQNALIYSACSTRATRGPRAFARAKRLAPRRARRDHLGDVVLSTGDGAGITAEPAVSLTASESSRDPARRPWRTCAKASLEFRSSLKLRLERSGNTCSNRQIGTILLSYVLCRGTQLGRPTCRGLVGALWKVQALGTAWVRTGSFRNRPIDSGQYH